MTCHRDEKRDKHMTNISCDSEAASIQKYEETSPIRIEIIETMSFWCSLIKKNYLYV